MEDQDLKRAEALLISATGDPEITTKIYSRLETCRIQNWSKKLHYNLQHIKDLCKDIFENFSQERSDVISALDLLIFNETHDIIMPAIKTHLSEEDSQFSEKLKILSDLNVSAEQFGADINYSIPLNAAVVELSVLDVYKTPMSKMQCLTATFDLIFAELKTAIVESISITSDKEVDIPVIDNKEIIPLLMVVIIKSKTKYLFSNLFYISNFYYNLAANQNEMAILQAFEVGMANLNKIKIEALQPATSKLDQSIDVTEYFKLTLDEKPQFGTLLDQEKMKILSRINISTLDDNE